MSQDNQAALQVEEEMNRAVKELQESIADLEQFQTASASLREMAEQHRKVLAVMIAAAKALRDGAQDLSAESIGRFEEKLAAQEETVRGIQKTLANQSKAISVIASGVEATRERNRKQFVMLLALVILSAAVGVLGLFIS